MGAGFSLRSAGLQADSLKGDRSSTGTVTFGGPLSLCCLSFYGNVVYARRRQSGGDVVQVPVSRVVGIPASLLAVVIHVSS